MRIKYHDAKAVLASHPKLRNPEALKVAVSILYNETGGNKWLNPTRLNGIANQAAAQVANMIQAQSAHTPVLSTHEWRRSLEKQHSVLSVREWGIEL